MSDSRQLQRAQAAFGGGDPRAAARLCQQILTEDPRDLGARHLYGRCLAAQAKWADAAAEFRRALAAHGGYLPALIDLGITETFGGNYNQAQPVLERAIALDPRPAEPYFGLGLCRLGTGDARGAVHAFREATQRNPAFPDAHNNLGVAYDRLGLWSDAEASFRRALAFHPDHADATRNLGVVLLKRDPAAAAAALARAAELLPADAGVRADLGAAQLACGDWNSAVISLRQALALDRALAGAATNLGEALRQLRQPDAATAAFERALELDRRLAEAYLGLGRLAAARGEVEAAVRNLTAAARNAGNNVKLALAIAAALEELGAAAAAHECLQAAAAASPANAELQDAQGELLHRLGRLPEALDCYERALHVDERRPQTLLNCGRALESMGALDRAMSCFEQLLNLRPADTSALASIASCAIRRCDWELTDSMLARLRQSAEGIDALPAFLMLSSPLSQAEVAHSLRRRAGAAVWPEAHGPALRSARGGESPDRLRVAYLSPDFCAHPLAYAIAGVIERHDRARVASIGISLKAPDASPIAARLRGAFDEFVDASALADRAIVKLMRERGVEVAIDLAGLTTGSRTAIFAMRAAPVQINFLGFPGSMGMVFMDYLIADSIVLPRSHEEFYAEKILRMPDSYLPFDDRRDLPIAGGREAAGLPAAGFVFCAFSNSYKITREMFDVWMKLLRDVPGSVLWLRAMGAAAEENLRRAALRSHIAVDRLIFAPFEATIEAHLSRLRLADLFLDTLPYNAHTTAAEALWAEVPVISCRGEGFAGRVGASLLSACGLSELVCADLQSYRSRAAEIAHSGVRHAKLREHLRQSRGAPLFDTGSYTRNLEGLLFAAARNGATG